MNDVTLIIILILVLILILVIADFLGFMLYGFNFEKFHSKSRYDILLPESPPVSKQHRENIQRGKNIASQSSVVICCLCRDIEDRFNVSKSRMEKLGNFFGQYAIVIFENDSKDKSRELLKDWSKDNPHVHVLDCPDTENCQFKAKQGYKIDHGDRIRNMCFFRNRYLNHVKKHYTHYDYMIVYDFDLEGGFLESGIYDSLGREEEWDGIFANGRMPLPPFGAQTFMYDALAFMKDEKSYNQTILTRFWDQYQLKGDIGAPLIPVMSAFNGLAIYKMSSILDSRYIIAPKSCGHVGLHDNMRQNNHDKLFINPSMLLYAGMQGPANRFKTAWEFWHM